MTTVKDLSSEELILFRKKMIAVYDTNDAPVKAEAGVVLSMIEEELLARGIEEFEEKSFSLNKGFTNALSRLKALFQRQPVLAVKRS